MLHFIIIAASVLVAASFGTLLLAVRRAPEGVETEEGFIATPARRDASAHAGHAAAIATAFPHASH